MIVADASVVVDMLLGGGSEAGDELATRFQTGQTICAPHLIDAEVAQVLRRFVLQGSLTSSAAADRVTDLVDLPIQRFPRTSLISRALELLQNVTVYDGLYLVLAEVLDAPLLTGDRALAKVPGCRATVRVVATGG